MHEHQARVEFCFRLTWGLGGWPDIEVPGRAGMPILGCMPGGGRPGTPILGAMPPGGMEAAGQAAPRPCEPIAMTVGCNAPGCIPPASSCQAQDDIKGMSHSWATYWGDQCTMWHHAGRRGHAGWRACHGRGLHRNRVLLLLRSRGLLVLGRQQARGQRASRWRCTGA